jgi:hypothetical protein
MTSGKLTKDVTLAQQLSIIDQGNGAGYTLQDAKTGLYYFVNKNGGMKMSTKSSSFDIWSVTYPGK